MLLICTLESTVLIKGTIISENAQATIRWLAKQYLYLLNNKLTTKTRLPSFSGSPKVVLLKVSFQLLLRGLLYVHQVIRRALTCMNHN